MKEKFEDKPWYFALVAVSYFSSHIFEPVISWYWGEEEVKEFLGRTLLFSQLLPWIVGTFILIVCMIIYIWQLRKNKKNKENNIPPQEVDKLKSILSDVITDKEYIESIQAFQYWPKNGEGRKYIKLCFLTGVADERIEINTILQTFFYLTYPNYRKANKLSQIYDKYLSTKDSDDWTYFLQEGQKFCDQLIVTLNAIQSVEQISDFHCELYRIAVRILSKISNEAIENILNNPEVETALIQRKRTGILGGIFLKDIYIFKNEDNLTEENRIYFTLPYVNSKNIILVGSIDESGFASTNSTAIESYCKEVADAISSHRQI